ncbi:hypothetical protein EGR_10687 [Echinococcus granulosus]|uniref:Uncharacterized protein n=1 Tax=Echinococcus granulosus TaxID=6210 RepID=W6U0D2_ECHGR|nr:hypothetical protein EGR_10687 [Echinococcus granulosus]EUB54453.1 hypothetical protein EGR_10687 [Echinococcus granulosus]
MLQWMKAVTGSDLDEGEVSSTISLYEPNVFCVWSLVTYFLSVGRRCLEFAQYGGGSLFLQSAYVSYQFSQMSLITVHSVWCLPTTFSYFHEDDEADDDDSEEGDGEVEDDTSSDEEEEESLHEAEDNDSHSDEMEAAT